MYKFSFLDLINGKQTPQDYQTYPAIPGQVVPQGGGLLGGPGGFDDPKTLGLLGAAASLLESSGPSPTPVSFGQAIGRAGMTGLGGYQSAKVAQTNNLLNAYKLNREIKNQEMMDKLTGTMFPPGAPSGVAGGVGSGGVGGPSGMPNIQAGYVVKMTPTGPQVEFDPAKALEVAQKERGVNIDEAKARWEFGYGAPGSVSGRGASVGDGMTPKQRAELAAKRAEERPKAEMRVESGINKASIVSNKVDEALKDVGFWTTGLTGSVLGKIPGTSAYDLDKTVDTIKANIGFNELQAMRESSPTGGALGQVAVRELDFLQAAIASLDQGQSPEKLVDNLNAVKTHFNNWKAITEESYKNTYGDNKKFPVGSGVSGGLQKNTDGSFTYTRKR